MAKNEFKPFATANGANVTSQSDYESLPARSAGFQSGKASSAQINKAIRQATVIASVVAQFIANESGEDVLDDGDVATLQQSLLSALRQNAADNLPKASTTVAGITALSSATNSSDETLAATPKAVKAANDNANGRVPSGRKVNGKALDADITLSAGDVGAYTKTETDTALEKKVNTTQLQKSQDDTTAGALVINGGHGLGANARPRAAGATGGAAGCGFFSYAAGNADNPFGGTGASGIHVQEAATYGWDLLGRDGGGVDFRVRQISNGNASAWAALWTSANLTPADMYGSRGSLGTVDLDTLFGQGYRGTWDQGTTANATLARNYPIVSAGSLEVLYNAANGVGTLQRYTTHASNRIFIRYKAANADAWSAWAEQWTSANLPNPATLGNTLSTNDIAGIPLPFPGAIAPSGWLKCNGQAFNTTLYPILAARYPSGNLPELRAEFIRGADDGRGVDTGRALLSAQGDAIRNITGKFANNGLAFGEGASSSVGEGAFTRLEGRIPSNNDLGDVGCQYELDISKVVPTANENRPRNIAFNYIVRAA